MMVLIASIGLVLYRYSVRYLQSDHGQSRYQALLALTISTLLVMVSSRDLVLLLLVWQLLSWLLCWFCGGVLPPHAAKLCSFQAAVVESEHTTFCA